ncbi:MAG: hypothetical protein JKY81_11105 [Colwellia sp.]|nr:hypothetical protein [Colwellia sp.]
MNKLNFLQVVFLVFLSFIYVAVLSTLYIFLDPIFLSFIGEVQTNNFLNNFLLGIRHIPIITISGFLMGLLILKKFKNKYLLPSILIAIPAFLLCCNFIFKVKSADIGIFNIIAILLIVFSPVIFSFLIKTFSVQPPTHKIV